MGFLSPFAFKKKKVAHCDGLHCHFCCSLTQKHFLLKLARASISFYHKKNVARPFFIYDFIFMVGYYNEYSVVCRQLFCQLYLNKNEPINSYFMWWIDTRVISCHTIIKFNSYYPIINDYNKTHIWNGVYVIKK